MKEPPSLDQIISNSPRVAPGSKSHYRSIVRNFVEFADGRPPSPEIVAEWRDDLVRRRMRPNSIAGYLRALRFVGERYPHGDFTAGVPNPPHQVNQSALTLNECRRLLETTRGPGARNRRDRAMIALMLGAALKPSEASTLHVRDLTLDPARVLNMWLGPVTVALAAPWVRECPGPSLFLGIRGAGNRTRVSPLTREGISKTMRRRAREARVFRFTPKRLRFTFGLLATEDGWSAEDVDIVMNRGPSRDRFRPIDVIAHVISLDDAVGLDVANPSG